MVLSFHMIKSDKKDLPRQAQDKHDQKRNPPSRLQNIELQFASHRRELEAEGLHPLEVAEHPVRDTDRLDLPRLLELHQGAPPTQMNGKIFKDFLCCPEPVLVK